MPRFTSSFWLWSMFAALIVLTAARAALRFEGSADEISDKVQKAAVIVLPLTDIATTVPSQQGSLMVTTTPATAVVHDTLQPNDSIYLSLKKHGVSDLQLVQLNNALSKFFDASRSKPGDTYELTIDKNGVVISFVYCQRNYPERLFVVEQLDAGLTARQVVEALDTVVVSFEVTIKDNLSNAIASAGESDFLTDIVADMIFGSVIDFQKDPRTGDRLGIVVRKLYREGTFVRDDRILMARYDGKIVSQVAVFYEFGAGAGYYDTNGKSVERMFLLSPLSYRRISSGFSHKRFHPILKRNVPHLGMDFAAAKGTKVWATARGKVTYAARKGGYGKLVEIEHPNGYRTRYAHLSRIAVRKGQRVEKFDTVGRVGATGRATGPHLHYELLQNGRHQNPARVNRHVKGNPLPENQLTSYFAHRDGLLARINAATSNQTASIPHPLEH